MTDLASSSTRISFRVNGQEVSVSPDHPHLLAALRDELDITSPKDGCSPSGQCGCCTVMIDGKAQVSCTYALSKAEGRDIVTLEGIDDAEREKTQEQERRFHGREKKIEANKRIHQGIRS